MHVWRSPCSSTNCSDAVHPAESMLSETLMASSVTVPSLVTTTLKETGSPASDRLFPFASTQAPFVSEEIVSAGEKGVRKFLTSKAPS